MKEQKQNCNAEQISALLKYPRQVFVTHTTSSTNDWAAECSGEAKNGSLFLAEQQTKGRGRQGRVWESACGEGLFLSVLQYPSLPPEQVMKLTLCGALAVCNGIEVLTGLAPMIKWPNDIVIGNKKVCGILTEMKVSGERPVHVVTGIGVNVNQKSFPKELQQIATSFFLETGKEWDKNQLTAAICDSLYEMQNLLEDNRFPMEDYRRRCVTLGREVRVISPLGEYPATALEVTENGELIVALADGTRQQVVSGEVSVRGLFGYV